MLIRHQGTERAAGWLLAAVLAVSFGLRLWMSLKLPFFFDDHYVISNILGFLKGSLRPRHAYYGSLSYIPQALVLAVCDFLHSRTGIAALAVHGTDFQGLTLGAYRITRMFVLAYGMLSIWMIYLVGRRLFSPWVGVIAAAVLAAYPRHLRSSVELKPDMLALLLTVITLYWTVGATRSPRLSRFLLAGVGVGLATAAKYTGVASALPLTVWALWTGFRDHRRWGWPVLAGVTAMATFFVMNPFISTVLYYAPRLVHGYAAHARQDRSDHWTVLRREIELIASSHGWILGAFLVLGTLLLLHQLWRRPEGGERTDRTTALLLLGLFIGYPILHAMAMTLFRRQNLMPAMAGAALICAYGMVRCGEWLGRSRAFTRAPALMILAALVPASVLVAQPFGYAYTEVVPTTWDAAQETLRARLATLRGRHIAYESRAVKQLGPLEDWRRTVTTGVPSLATLPPAWLDLTDAEVFPLAQIQGPQAAFYESRRRRVAEGNAVEIPAKAFTNRGTPLLVLLHPWTQAGDAVPLGLQPSGHLPGDLAVSLPDAGEVVSIEILWPAEIPTTALELQPGNQMLPLLYGGNRHRQIRFLTSRFRVPPGAEIRIPGSAQADPTRFRQFLWRWADGPLQSDFK